MEDANKVAIAKFVMRSKQYIAALRPKNGTLLLSMMVYADEINDPSEIGEFDEVAKIKVEKKELAMANQLIESLSEPFEPEMYHDTYRQQVLDLIDRKASGESIVAAITPAPSADKVIDLMAALEASVKAAKTSRSRHPTAIDEADQEGLEMGDEPAAPRRGRAAAKKAAPAKRARKSA